MAAEAAASIHPTYPVIPVPIHILSYSHPCPYTAVSFTELERHLLTTSARDGFSSAAATRSLSLSCLSTGIGDEVTSQDKKIIQTSREMIGFGEMADCTGWERVTHSDLWKHVYRA